MKAVLLVLAVAGCAASPAAPPAVETPQACRIRPVTVNSRDFFSPDTLREIRRVNRELRQHCAG